MPMQTKSGEPLFLEFSQTTELVDDTRFPGEKRLSTRAYYYGVRRDPDDLDSIISWHWGPLSDAAHPYHHIHTGVTDPLGKGKKLHIPGGGRVTLEEVIYFLIDEWDVIPAREDWQEVLKETLARFRQFQTQDRQ